MPKLKSMKMPKREMEKMAEPSSIATDRPMYPWGLSVSLDTCCLAMLGLDASDFQIGEAKTLIARVEVTGISSSESKDGDANQSVQLQITDMCLEEGDEAKKAAAALYDK